ncbi:MAG: hypothetical protein LQ339_004638 [Xanthoria mediterranea]|nr:MAG: hypothetical protein LQ339_004638 [Xanthoria mediterranea]
MSLGRIGQQAKQCLKNQLEYQHLGAFVPSTSNVESVVEYSRAADERYRNGSPLSMIDGQLVAIKDNICTTHQPTTCASETLQAFRSPFSATVVERLKAAGAIVAGKTNLDEFGMGSHSVNSVQGPVKSPGTISANQRSVGGSSGGSALATSTRQCFAALATDTGGSVRLPAAWTGTVGFKPSYGIVSRWGVVAYANSLDTVGVIARSVEAAKQVYDVIKGHDPRDPTTMSSLTRSRINLHLSHRPRNERLRIGIPREYLLKELHPSIHKHWSLVLQSLRRNGHSVHLTSLPTTKAALAAYYVLAPAEASSNLARFDGVRYGIKAPNDREKSNVLFSNSRGHNFGAEVRRRILLGSYTLSSTAMDNYFVRAQKVRRLVQDDFNKVFAMKHPLLQHRQEDPSSISTDGNGEGTGVDIIITPTSLNLPPLLSSLRSQKKTNDPTNQFQEDLYTVPASLAGLPAISVPVPCKDWQQVGLQVVGQYGDDELVLDAARELEGVLKDGAGAAAR